MHLCHGRIARVSLNCFCILSRGEKSKNTHVSHVWCPFFLQNQVPPVKSPLQQALSEPLGAAAAPGPRGDGRDAPTRQGGPKHRPPPVGGPQGLCVPSLPSEGDQRSLPATPEPRTPEPDFETKRDVSGVLELSSSQQMISSVVVGRCCKSAVTVFKPAMVASVVVG